MSAEADEGIRTFEMAEVIEPGRVFSGMSLDGRPITLTHARDDDLRSIEPNNPRHDRLIVNNGGDTSDSYPWHDVTLLGQGEPLIGIARVYQTYVLASDPYQAALACSESIQSEQERSS